MDEASRWSASWPMVPSDSAAGQRDAVVQRRDPGDRLDEDRQRLDREERPREQEQRRDPEAEHRRRSFSGVRCVAANAAIGAANASPVRTATGMARTMSGDAAAPNERDDER